MTFFLEMQVQVIFLMQAFFRPLDNQGFSYRLVLFGYILILTGQALLYVLLSICINCKYAKLELHSFSTVSQFLWLQSCSNLLMASSSNVLL